MTVFKWISDNIEIINKLARIGIFPVTIFFHFTVYARFDYYIKLGKNRCLSILNTADDFHLGERHVYRIIKEMESTI